MSGKAFDGPRGVESAVTITLTGDEEVGFRSGIVGPGDTPYFAICPVWPNSQAVASHLGLTVYMEGGTEMTLQFLKGLQGILNDLAKEVESIARRDADPGLVTSRSGLYIDQLDIAIDDDPEVRALRHAGITSADGHADGTD